MGSQVSTKHLDKHKRQKCIQLLENMMKSLFTIFRNPNSTVSRLVKRVEFFDRKLDQLGVVHLDAEYHRAMKRYAVDIITLIKGSFVLDDIRDKQMTKLNGLQKLKQANVYKRSKSTSTKNYHL